MNDYRVFVLLAWDWRLGAYVYPVGVMGVPAKGAPYVSWVPLTYEAARPWHRRLLGPVSAERVDTWLASGQLAEAEPPDAQVPVTDAVEGLLDMLIVGVVPVLQAGGR